MLVVVMDGYVQQQDVYANEKCVYVHEYKYEKQYLCVTITCVCHVCMLCVYVCHVCAYHLYSQPSGQ
ncbi:hypothetical protein EON63_14530 [archaeon]|nr:MAG: hypothetical protein EON63_14530 [archaeon]